ncbi:MAG: hypothetical protein V4724_32285 [Pseudomonadota bacterium]
MNTSSKLAMAAICATACGSAWSGVGFDTADGWKYSTDGWIILQAHRQNGDTRETTGFRITSGSTPSLIAFNVSAPALDGIALSSRVGLYINPQSGEGNFRNAGNVGNTGAKALDPREIWGKLSAGWGEIIFGKAYSIYQGEAVLADASVLAGGLTGYDNVNTTNALAASFNAGYMYANFNAGVRYNSPQSEALTISLGVYDPSQIRNVFVGSGADQTKAPRVEAGLYFKPKLGAASVKLYTDFVYQSAQHCRTAAGAPCADDRVTTRGASAGATLDIGAFNLHLSGFSASGLGSVLMQDLDALDANGAERRSRGYFGQIVYRPVAGLSLRYSHGRTRIDDTAVTLGHTARTNIVGAYYGVNKYLTVYGELADSRFSNNPAFNVPTDTRYATAGARFMW